MNKAGRGEYLKAYYQKNKKRMDAQTKAWMRKHPDKKKKMNEAYREKVRAKQDQENEDWINKPLITNPKLP